MTYSTTLPYVIFDTRLFSFQGGCPASSCVFFFFFFLRDTEAFTHMHHQHYQKQQ